MFVSNVISIWFRKLIQYLDHHLSKNVYRMIQISSWYSLYILTFCALLPNWFFILLYMQCEHSCCVFLAWMFPVKNWENNCGNAGKFSQFFSRIFFWNQRFPIEKKWRERMSKMSSIKAHGMVTWLYMGCSSYLLVFFSVFG